MLALKLSVKLRVPARPVIYFLPVKHPCNCNHANCPRTVVRFQRPTILRTSTCPKPARKPTRADLRISENVYPFDRPLLVSTYGVLEKESGCRQRFKHSSFGNILSGQSQTCQLAELSTYFSIFAKCEVPTLKFRFRSAGRKATRRVKKPLDFHKNKVCAEYNQNLPSVSMHGVRNDTHRKRVNANRTCQPAEEKVSRISMSCVTPAIQSPAPTILRSSYICAPIWLIAARLPMAVRVGHINCTAHHATFHLPNTISRPSSRIKTGL
ncbi:hypothetical protein HYPSUDRAFT_831705 [Hypholoma sublateritium FD-334 SS-4]|uniref:Uncharacterized protein n=1 Tax=Hypholoma sublateritium (strain FD-334 SS-4) TaxID=945553 RepID=A0A0D2NUF1_HYPSF|nr:hypothetical protein HYPSUDRAFT_831705 [Hypholoma sublateritium FD-334 SS-4]